MVSSQVGMRTLLTNRNAIYSTRLIKSYINYIYICVASKYYCYLHGVLWFDKD